jgi:hypothetical protein
MSIVEAMIQEYERTGVMLEGQIAYLDKGHRMYDGRNDPAKTTADWRARLVNYRDRNTAILAELRRVAVLPPGTALAI